MGFRRLATGAVIAGGAGLLAWKINAADSQYPADPNVRRVWDGDVASENPGVVVWPDALGSDLTKPLMGELQGLKKYGIDHITPHQAGVYRFQQSYLPKDASPPVNMLRITGRPESHAQNLPPWGYGDDFQGDQLPPQLQRLVARVREVTGIKGPLRDVTINYRHSTFLRLDPHIDPPPDGEHVVIVGLDSDTVLTLCPSWGLVVWRAWEGLRQAVTLEDEREGVRRAAERSWTPWDLDVLARAQSLVHLQGPARWTWTHGTRLGIPVPGLKGLHDWWGSKDRVITRGPERHSIVLAFGPEDGHMHGHHHPHPHHHQVQTRHQQD